MTSPTDHLPDVDFGVILNGCFVILSSIYSRRRLFTMSKFRAFQ
jgi:hypothetical protein